MHDGELHRSYIAQIDAANDHIAYLKRELRQKTLREEEYNVICQKLHESEVARTTEAATRLRYERHLRLEQLQSGSFAQAVDDLQQHMATVMADYGLLHQHCTDMATAMEAFNEFSRKEVDCLQRGIVQNRQEISHCQQTSKSHGNKIVEYEATAAKLVTSPQSTVAPLSPKPESSRLTKREADNYGDGEAEERMQKKSRGPV